MEEIVGHLISHQPPLLKPPVLSALWQLCESAYRVPASQESAQDLRCGITVLSMAAAKQPSLVASQLGAMVEVRFICLTFCVSPYGQAFVLMRDGLGEGTVSKIELQEALQSII